MGLMFDVMAQTLFLGANRTVLRGPVGPGRIMDAVWAVTTRCAADPFDFYHMPRDRVIELRERVAMQGPRGMTNP